MGKVNSNKKNNDDKYKLVLPIIFMLLLVVSVVGITYSIFVYGKEGSVRNTLTTGSIVFNYTEDTNGISLVNATPISDSVGKNLDNNQGSNTYFDFSVSCKMAGTQTILYEIYATPEVKYNNLDSRYVKVYLTDRTTNHPVSGYDGVVPTYNKLKDSISKNGSKQLYYGSFSATGSQSFRLRMWLSDEYVIPSVSEHFKMKVNVEAVRR